VFDGKWAIVGAAGLTCEPDELKERPMNLVHPLSRTFVGAVAIVTATIVAAGAVGATSAAPAIRVTQPAMQAAGSWRTIVGRSDDPVDSSPADSIAEGVSEATCCANRSARPGARRFR
jgi:hypothetical protein